MQKKILSPNFHSRLGLFVFSSRHDTNASQPEPPLRRLPHSGESSPRRRSGPPVVRYRRGHTQFVKNIFKFYIFQNLYLSKILHLSNFISFKNYILQILYRYKREREREERWRERRQGERDKERAREIERVLSSLFCIADQGSSIFFVALSGRGVYWEYAIVLHCISVRGVDWEYAIVLLACAVCWVAHSSYPCNSIRFLPLVLGCGLLSFRFRCCAPHSGLRPSQLPLRICAPPASGGPSGPSQLPLRDSAPPSSGGPSGPCACFFGPDRTKTEKINIDTREREKERKVTR